MSDSELVASLYTGRPTQEYIRAYGKIFEDCDTWNGNILAVFSSPFHAVEMLKRCPKSVDIAGTGIFNQQSFATESVGWTRGGLRNADLSTAGTIYATQIWAEPEGKTATQTARLLRARASNQTNLYVIVSGPLRSFLPVWESSPLPAERPLNPGSVGRLLKLSSWRVREMIVFHGARSIAWTFLARTAQLVGRSDWGDRCILAMRKRYQEPGWMWPLAPLALIHAQPA